LENTPLHEQDAMVRDAHELQRQDRVGDAIEAYTRILTRWPTLADCWFNLAYLLRRSRNFVHALNCYQKALEHGISAPESVHLNRAVIYADHLRQDEAAERELTAALALDPSYVPAQLNLANLHEDRGRRAEATALYERILEAQPTCFLALARLAGLRPRAACDAALAQRLREALSHPAAATEDRATLGFALGRVLDAVGEYPAAFAAYVAANRESRASAAPAYVRYDRAAQEALTARLIATPQPAPVPVPLAARPRPVFVLGMFRSGSTLAEQLLSAHPDVGAAGELDLLPSAIAAGLMPFPEALAAAPPAGLAALAAGYRSVIAGLFPGARLVTDKRPDNFLCIGLIKTLFPDALIVHTVRDPIDNCLSAYFLHLDLRMSYALDLRDTGHYYREYRRVMAHWKSRYGGDIVDFDYDRFVRDPEPAARELYGALGLAWDARYLEARRSGGGVKTASVWQVREPLYAHASGRARHYETEVAALRADLADLVAFSPTAGSR
jgi:tetratricopeptide (TPR) repeat protein